MSSVTPAAEDCRNDGCRRSAEPGEVYCAECGLERDLFRRHERMRDADLRSGREGESVRRSDPTTP